MEDAVTKLPTKVIPKKISALVGGPGEPVAEQTKFGWSIMSPGAEFDKGTMLFTQTSRADFEDLCRLNILGLADTPVKPRDGVRGLQRTA